MSIDMNEIKNTQDEISKVLNDFQEAHKGILEENKSNTDTLANLQTAFTEMSSKNEELVSTVESEKKARTDLELAMSKIQEAGGDPSELKGNPEYKSAFVNYLWKRQAITPEAIDDELKTMIKLESGKSLSDSEIMGLKSLLVGSDPDGGYLVPVERQSVIKKRVFETTPMRQLASIYTIGTEATEFVIDDGEFGSTKVGELDARPETDTSQIGIKTIATKEQYAMPIATQKIIDDAVFNIEAWLSGKISDRFARVENAETINGIGANEMEGIGILPDWATLGVYERDALETRPITGTGGTTIAANDLIDVQSDLLEPYQPNAHWMFHRKVWAEIMKLVDTTGQYLLNPQMLFAGVAPQLLGAPVRLSGDMPDATTDEGIIGYYGDFREGYAMVDRIGIRVLRDPYTTKGVIKFYATKRTGAGVVNYQAIKRLGASEIT